MSMLSNVSSFILSTLLILFTSCGKKATSPDEPEPPNTDGIEIIDEPTDILGELNSIISPLSGFEPQQNDSDLKILEPLKDARIVGLGEATHGTKEFFEMKHRIIKYLVERHGFKAVGFEADFGESIYFDRYITTGEGDLDDLMKNKMHFWVWRTTEVKALFNWMRDYNRGRSPEDMIHYYGFDCQFLTYGADLLNEYLMKVAPAFLDSSSTTLVEKTRLLDRDAYENMSVTEFYEISNSLQELYEQFSDKEEEFVPLSSVRKFGVVKHLLEVMINTHDYLSSRKTTTLTSKRDRYMAEHAMWITDFMGKNTKVVLWAHNGHVITDENEYLGSNLQVILGHEYQNVGFSFSKGGFNARRSVDFVTIDVNPKRNVISIEPLSGSVNALFYKAKYDNFILAISRLKDDGLLMAWFSGGQDFLQVGSVYNRKRPELFYGKRYLNTDFDYVIHFNSTNESTLMN
jgi:erythromycin esterase